LFWCWSASLEGAFGQSAHLTICATYLVNGDVQLINKREIKQFLGLDLLFSKDLLAIFFIAVNSE